MHNLHLARVKASSAKEACNAVETAIMDFGNENNWRSICGAVSEHNEVYNSGDGRYSPESTDYTTIEKINEGVNGWMNECFYGAVAKEKFEKGEIDLSQWNSHELWSLSKWAKHLSEVADHKDKPFNVLTDTFYDYQYDECGVTDLEWSVNDGDTIWIVFIDMHS